MTGDRSTLRETVRKLSDGMGHAIGWAFLAVALDVWVVWLSLDARQVRALAGGAEQLGTLKLLGAAALQVASVGALVLFTRLRRRSPNYRGPREDARRWLLPYFWFGLALSISLSLLYNALACPSKSLPTSRGEPQCSGS